MMLNFPRVGSKFIHQVLHQINFFNPNSESCVNTIGVDNDTLDETLDTLDAFDDILDAFDGKSDTFDGKSYR